MKTLILTFVIALSNFAFANSVCVDIKDAGWSENKFETYPDGSIMIENPTYNYNGKSYSVGFADGAVAGLCRAFGRKVVRSDYHEIKRSLVIHLNKEGAIADTYASEYVISRIQCK